MPSSYLARKRALQPSTPVSVGISFSFPLHPILPCFGSPASTAVLFFCSAPAEKVKGRDFTSRKGEGCLFQPMVLLASSSMRAAAPSAYSTRPPDFSRLGSTQPDGPRSLSLSQMRQKTRLKTAKTSSKRCPAAGVEGAGSALCPQPICHAQGVSGIWRFAAHEGYVPPIPLG